jgi:hypothetical protein
MAALSCAPLPFRANLMLAFDTVFAIARKSSCKFKLVSSEGCQQVLAGCLQLLSWLRRTVPQCRRRTKRSRAFSVRPVLCPAHPATQLSSFLMSRAVGRLTSFAQLARRTGTPLRPGHLTARTSHQGSWQAAGSSGGRIMMDGSAAASTAHDAPLSGQRTSSIGLSRLAHILNARDLAEASPKLQPGAAFSRALARR